MPRGHKSGVHGPNSVVGKKLGEGQHTARQGEGSCFCSRCSAWLGELGQEPAVDMFVEHLVIIFSEIKRILKPTGTCYVNMGDTYGGSNSVMNDGGRQGMGTEAGRNRVVSRGIDKCMMMVPEKFMIKIVENNWLLRNKIIWYKPNAMPSSVTDRLNCTWEYIFFFSKSKKYYYDLDAIREEHKTLVATQKNKTDDGQTTLFDSEKYAKERNLHPVFGPFINPQVEFRDKTKDENYKTGGMRNAPEPGEANAFNIAGKNPGDFFENDEPDIRKICPQPFPDSHYAVFPEELCRKPILASCPDEVCAKCGQPKVKVYEKGEPDEDWKKQCGADKSGGYQGQGQKDYEGNKVQNPSDVKRRILAGMCERKFVGYRECKCGEGFVPGIVLDPFAGSGTACLVANKLGRRYIGIDLSPENIKMANKRIEGEGDLLFMGGNNVKG